MLYYYKHSNDAIVTEFHFGTLFSSKRKDFYSSCATPAFNLTVVIKKKRRPTWARNYEEMLGTEELLFFSASG